MYSVKIYNTITQIKKELWDSLTENNIYMCYDWLKTIELTFTRLGNPYYIMIFDGDKPAAASVCYFEKKEFNKKRHTDEILLGKLLKVKWIKNLSFYPVILCNPRRSFGTHVVFSSESKNQNKLLQKMLEVIENIAAKNKASICFQYVMNHEFNLMKELNRRGYYKTKSLPLNYIDIKWSSFSEYKHYLKQKRGNMKGKVTSEINKNKREGVIIKQIKDVSNYQERLWELLKMNFAKYNKGGFSLKSNFFYEMKENFGDNSIIYAAVKNNEIIGVMVAMRKRRVESGLFVGVDHNRSQNDFTYFNITYYEPIKNAIESGIELMYYGNSLYKTKMKRGCATSETYLFYKPHQKFMNIIIKNWFKFHYWRMSRKLSYIKQL